MPGRFFDAPVAKPFRRSSDVQSGKREGGGSTDAAVGEPAIEGATTLAVDPSGNVYLGGSFVKTISLQGGANPAVTLTDNGATGINYESFVAKYDANGDNLWVKNIDNGTSLVGAVIAVNAAGEIFLTGRVLKERWLS